MNPAHGVVLTFETAGMKKRKNPTRVGLILLIGAPASIPVVWILIQGLIKLLAIAGHWNQGLAVGGLIFFTLWCILAAGSALLGIMVMVTGAAERSRER